MLTEKQKRALMERVQKDGRSTLSPEQSEEVLRRAADGEMYSTIAKDFGVTVSAIRQRVKKAVRRIEVGASDA